MMKALFFLSLVVCVAVGESASLISQCTENYFTQYVDHFGQTGVPGNTFRQRYFLCPDPKWRASDGSPVFFYTGNEADVTLYLNHTGLMWENRAKFKALLVFAEHRYFGRSTLDPLRHGLRYLSSAQALEDFAALIAHLRSSLGLPEGTPFVAFGGSYGGMLSAWLRMKHPESVVGAIAASAPIAAFLGLTPAYDSEAYFRIITDDAGPKCAEAIRRSWSVVRDLARTPSGRAALTAKLFLCETPKTQSEAEGILPWAQDAIGYLAMGHFPYPSTYLTNGGCMLPAWPVDVACSRAMEQSDPIEALREAVGVFLNCSGTKMCLDLHGSVNNETLIVGNQWDYLACTEMLMPFSTDGVKDMFWNEPFDLAAYSDGCAARQGIRPRAYEPVLRYGGIKALKWASNIIFSNGEFDPWRAGGIVPGMPGLPASVIPIVITRGAHHLDLMFSDPADPQSVIDARRIEIQQIDKWVNMA